MIQTDLAALFDPPVCPTYRSVEEEIRAVSEGKKLVSTIGAKKGDRFSNAFESAALQAGLACVIHPDDDNSYTSPGDGILLFALKFDQLWRVPAYITSRKVIGRYPWSDGLEFLESNILGYSDEQVAEWMTLQRHLRLGWVGKTVYFKSSKSYVMTLKAVDSKHFIDSQDLRNNTIFFVSMENRPIRRELESALGPEERIGRIAVTHESYNVLFKSSWTDHIDHVRMMKADLIDVTSLNKGLVAPIEIFEGQIWAS